MTRSRNIDPSRQRVVKFFPSIPPSKGDILLVDGERVRVTRAKVEYDGPQWTIRRLRVKPAPGRTRA